MIKKIFNRNITGGQIIHDKLLQHDVKDVFLYSGGAIMPLVDTFYNSDINYYVNTHEQNTGHAATGYAKSTGKTGVAIVTSGPGLTNLVTPILDATNDSTPLIVFSGQVPLKAMGTNAFQECPAVDITRSVTKWSYCVKDGKELPEVVDKAFKIANDGKKGAVHIDLPKCVISQNYNLVNFELKKEEEKDEVDINIDEIADVINNSKKPILYLGQGANNAYKHIREISKKGNIPATTTIHGMGIINEYDNLSLEMVGMHGSAYANYAIQEADCIIAIGCRFDDRTTGNLEKYAPKVKHIIHCNINKDEINNIVKSDYSVCCDAELFTMKLKQKILKKERMNWVYKIAELKRNLPFKYKKLDDNKIKTQDVLTTLNKILLENNLNEKTIISTGVGNHQMMAAQFIKWKYPNRMITSGSLGVMGAGLPYAIGSQIGNPNSLVIDIDGDSSFNHTLSDLKTIVEYNLPIKIFILNDNNQSMVRVWEELFFDKRYTATSCEKNPEYHLLANSYGIKSLYCHDSVNLSDMIHIALNYDGPILCHFKVETDKCLPLVAPGKGLDEMILESNNDFDFSNEMAPS